MIGLGIVLGALVLAALASELALNGTKLQTGLGRVLAAWTVVYLGAVYLVSARGHIGPIPFTILWGGAFLSWFGVRSHIESSVLLRMLYLLRRGPVTEAELLAAYTALYGPEMRFEELRRGKLTTRTHGTTTVAPKGKTILRIVALLR